jgi:3,4-dihydroxy-2-butanone 4-phosphate synthase
VSTPEKRLALNEALFRETNDRLEERMRVFVGEEEPFGILCECSDIDCVERIELTKEEYEQVRDDSAQFAVKIGHSIGGVEEVVARNDRFETVRKVGVAGEVAEFLDGQTEPRDADRG